jgi:hypothetical protein
LSSKPVAEESVLEIRIDADVRAIIMSKIEPMQPRSHFGIAQAGPGMSRFPKEAIPETWDKSLSPFL